MRRQRRGPDRRGRLHARPRRPHHGPGRRPPVQRRPAGRWTCGRTSGPTQTLDRCFGYAFREPRPDGRCSARTSIRRRIDGPVPDRGRDVDARAALHGDMPVLGFRVGRVAYCTDVSHIPEESYPAAEGPGRAGPGRAPAQASTRRTSTWNRPIEAARRIGAEQTWFTHIAHGLAHERPTGNCRAACDSPTTGSACRAGHERPFGRSPRLVRGRELAADDFPMGPRIAAIGRDLPC